MLKSARKTKDPEGRMPLADHLRELRNRLLKSLLAIGAVTVVALVYHTQLADFLTQPLRRSVGCVSGFNQIAKHGEHCATLNINGLLGPFTVMLKVGLMAGVVVASPVWLYQVWAFLAPGLHRHEKKYALSFVGAGFPLFLGGAWFAYTIIPTTAKALIGLTPDHVTNLVPLEGYLDLLVRMVLVFGLSFELPLLLVLLNFGGVLSGRRMLGWWRWMVMGITVFSAIAVPSPDPLSMLALAAPICALFFLAVGISLLHDKRKARRSDDGLSPDEASDLDLTPEALPEIEPVSAPSATDSHDGFDDAT
ncbi:twin-arginine translocase subunit TatC [Streptantibioticus ferralitis]|uniref:Sec-independent protein translocase protein TatC n=1 Tax=Streptantibioticus ferralitis TaxID=236510 RepID=A0ABT5Z6Y1_9ACTN|nr:twin-arginine translocase subunit TatC [Streptantibioticus ferralitis]MDF2259600.1 twin-arginine translocase subunit TatC [Streptantibioticus ferralitis]